MSPSIDDDGEPRRPVPSGGWTAVGDAVIDGLIAGLQEHVPAAAGIVLKGLSMCVPMAVAHLLGGSIAELAVGAGMGTTAPRLSGIGRLLRGQVRSK